MMTKRMVGDWVGQEGGRHELGLSRGFERGSDLGSLVSWQGRGWSIMTERRFRT